MGRESMILTIQEYAQVDKIQKHFARCIFNVKKHLLRKDGGM